MSFPQRKTIGAFKAHAGKSYPENANTQSVAAGVSVEGFASGCARERIKFSTAETKKRQIKYTIIIIAGFFEKRAPCCIRPLPAIRRTPVSPTN